jgi:hypothetical protein
MKVLFQLFSFFKKISNKMIERCRGRRKEPIKGGRNAKSFFFSPRSKLIFYTLISALRRDKSKRDDVRQNPEKNYLRELHSELPDTNNAISNP